MAILKETVPDTVTLEFRQEPGIDPDYGSCTWATFVLDKDAYSLTILSDCGNYSYKWVPTPKSESFLHLMARVDAGYLLDKVSARSTIDDRATYDAILRLIRGQGVDPDETNDDGDPVIDLDELREACGRDTDSDLISAVRETFEGTPMEDVDSYDLWLSVEKDFPPNARKIAEIFTEYVAPKCAELDARDAAAFGKE